MYVLQVLTNVGRVMKCVDSVAALTVAAVVYFSAAASEDDAAVASAVVAVKRWLHGAAPSCVDDGVGVGDADAHDSDDESEREARQARVVTEFDDDHRFPAGCTVRC